MQCEPRTGTGLNGPAAPPRPTGYLGDNEFSQREDNWRTGSATLRMAIEAEARSRVARRDLARCTGTVRRPLDHLRLKSPHPAAGQLDDDDSRPFAAGRDPCPRCATRGDLGCAHFRPCLPRDATGLDPVRELHPARHAATIEPKLCGRKVGAGLEAEITQFLAEKRMTLSVFCHAIGQATYIFFEKVRDGRLKPATVAKIRAFMRDYDPANAGGV